MGNLKRSTNSNFFTSHHFSGPILLKKLHTSRIKGKIRCTTKFRCKYLQFTVFYGFESRATFPW